jgi:carboxylesterase
LATVLVSVVVCSAALVIVSAALLVRALIRHRYDREGQARLAVGPDGIIPGAGPIDLPVAGNGRAPAALLLHGFGDTPQTLAYLAASLRGRGWSVRVPLLPGHGRTLVEWTRTRGADWLAAARDELEALRRAHESVALVGLSMGGALATLLAADDAAVSGGQARAPLVALALIAPYLAMPSWMQRLASLHWMIGITTPYVGGDSGSGERPSIVDAVERERSLAYGATTPKLVHELALLVRAARVALPAVTAPTLLVQSHADNRIAPAVAEWALGALTVADKRLVWIDHGGHVITVDRGRDEVAATVGDWLDAHLPARAESRRLRPA